MRFLVEKAVTDFFEGVVAAAMERIFRRFIIVL
jgi:hypothetical protein